MQQQRVRICNITNLAAKGDICIKQSFDVMHGVTIKMMYGVYFGLKVF